MRNFIALADERLTDAKSVDFCHRHLPPKETLTVCTRTEGHPALGTTAILVDSVRRSRTG
jgi:hypothetical protein